MLAKKVLEKYKETWKLLKKEEEFLFKRFREKNDYLAQKKSKLIDFNWKDRCKCISCDKIMYRSEANWCHRIDKWRSGNYRCRWEERNIRAWCTDCNNYNKERPKRKNLPLVNHPQRNFVSAFMVINPEHTNFLRPLTHPETWIEMFNFISLLLF